MFHFTSFNCFPFAAFRTHSCAHTKHRENTQHHYSYGFFSFVLDALQRHLKMINSIRRLLLPNINIHFTSKKNGINLAKNTISLISFVQTIFFFFRKMSRKKREPKNRRVIGLKLLVNGAYEQINIRTKHRAHLNRNFKYSDATRKILPGVQNAASHRIEIGKELN